LLTIARNLHVDELRRRRWKTVYVESSELDEAGAAPDGPGQAPADDEPIDAIVGYVRSLPAELQALYQARFVRGLSQRHAARALALTRRRVRTLEAHLLAGAARAIGVGRNIGKKKRPNSRPTRI
jgi:RNA polymerase sigma factor (sigma-70 family)